MYGGSLAVKCLVMFRNTQLLDKAPISTDELLALSGTFAEEVVPLAYPATDAYFHIPGYLAMVVRYLTKINKVH